ncbi:MAG: undecaprenyldiphospho-muramoylpentapeptide beta-N-acetylglucosaminyltransferase [Bacteroidales bacterium]|jgi:UDP-N-acetylglucosamine--N-acetylmuramyl-(pentapeptide) pyrophosphoryl-undecaprenol N-acetylglucosamine transferase|nr:undecaprenyldiphospho-muramoylpentapeptide beta-N-acetylglucosaminyltransferase [Bacteroidales bacterium]
MKIIISGGGSGGHIFPAVAIANAVKARWNDAEILFVGAEGRMEMEKVPAAGYKIVGLPIAGLQRKLTPANIMKNLQLPFRIMKSRRIVKSVICDFNPDIVVGVGGFASEPTLKTAAAMGYKTLLQEQNSYAGLTNKILARKAEKICVAYEGMERFFPKEKIVFTGNPVRADIEQMNVSSAEGRAHFGLETEGRVLLSVGGSLGARSINEMIINHLHFFRENKIQVIWQTGRWMYDQAVAAVERAQMGQWVKVHKFISRMDMAYAAADIVVSRAGAIAISELCLVGKPVVLIPSPNVAEDHQTKNALALVDRGAAVMVKDADCNSQGLAAVKDIFDAPEHQEAMRAAITKMAVRDAANKIVDQIDNIVYGPARKAAVKLPDELQRLEDLKKL